MMPGEGRVRIVACHHLGQIAMHNTQATGEGSYLRGKQSVGAGLAQKRVRGRSGLGANVASLPPRHPYAWTDNAAEITDPERIVLAYEQRDTAVLAEETCLGLDYAQP